MSSGHPPKRARLLADLRAIRGCTRSALAQVLSRLQAEGELPSNLGCGAPRTIRHRVASAVDSVLNIETPYGPLLQQFPMKFDGDHQVFCVNPSAFLYHLASLSADFFDILSALGHPPLGLRVMIYIDEVCPGNPLRPSKSRTTQCIYWSIAELPSHLLVQSRMWFLFTVVRSSVVSSSTGGVSALMKHTLHTFFPSDGTGLQRGVAIVNDNRHHLVRARFGGFVADEKALKETFSLKGASGSKPCLTCSNVVRLIAPEALQESNLVNMSCCAASSLVYHTKASVLQMVDRVRAAREHNMPQAQISKLEQACGITFDPDGVLADQHCRQIVDPVNHYIRDWMHTIASHGVAGTEMCMLIKTLVQSNYDFEMLRSWASRFKLPKTRGKVDVDWFSPTRIGHDSLHTFASEQLSMIPILLAFLDEVVAPALPEHRRCFRLLALIVAIFSCGPTESLSHLQVLRRSIVDHHTLFCKLYGDVIKPKLHHLLHIPEHMEHIGRLLGCFTMERKHRTTKQSALHVFRHFEPTVLKDLTHEQLQSIVDGPPLAPAYLIDASAIDGGLAKSSRCRLPCGEIHADDFVVLRNGSAAIVEQWWQDGADIALQCRVLPALGDNTFRVVHRGETPSFVARSDVRAAVVWAARSPDVVRLWPPLV